MSVTTFEPWTYIASCELGAVDPTKLDAIRSLGQSLLWGLTGRRFGTATTTAEGYYPPRSYAGVCPGPYKTGDGEWHNGLAVNANCCAIALYNQPVRAVLAVRVHGTVLDAGDYVLSRGRLLRIGACWSTLADDTCTAASVEVDYRWGVALPQEGQLALGEFVCEAVAGISGQSCRLPARTLASLNRQGVQQQFQPATDFDRAALSGLPLSDAWIRAVNPHRLVDRSRVFSPDMPRRG